MVPPQPDAAAQDRLDVPTDALVGRLQRRIAALERQLEARIAQVADLQVHLAEQQRRAMRVSEDGAVSDGEVHRKAAEYDALMATLTMRALRRPRAWYTQVRRRLHR